MCLAAKLRAASALDFTSGLGIRFDVKSRPDKIDTSLNPHRAEMRAEKGPGPGGLLKQTAHGECDRLRLVAAGELLRSFLDHRHDFGATDGDRLRQGHLVSLSQY